MTDGERSQEAEDVARFCEEWRLPNDVEPALARLVREGQIRCLQALAKDQCFGCQKDSGPQVSREGIQFHYSKESGAMCTSAFVHARIAALKQEG